MTQLVDLIEKGINHRGFSVVNIFQPCVTFNHVNSYSWYRERVYKLTPENHDPQNINKGWEASLEVEEKIPLGVIYDVERPIYTDGLIQLQSGSLVNSNLNLDFNNFEADFI